VKYPWSTTKNGIHIFVVVSNSVYAEIFI